MEKTVRIAPIQRTKTADFFIGAFASMGATVFSNPLELIKIRMQLQGELQKGGPKHYTGVFSGLYQIIQHEGILAIQKGLTPGLFYQFFMNGTRLGLYSYLQPRLFERDDPLFYGKTTLLAIFCGATGGAVGSPLYLVKTRLQSRSSHVAVGDQYNYSGIVDAFRKIVKEDGLKGLLRGVKAAAVRVSIGSSLQLPTYDQTKHKLQEHFPDVFKEGILLHVSSSIVSGLAVTTAMNPFDVISTRIYNQSANKGKGEQYKGIIDCGMRAIKTEGPMSLYKGWIAHLTRLMPHTMLTFVFLEQLKKLHNKYIS
jgi:solute carrier family 25 protein 34/35